MALIQFDKSRSLSDFQENPAEFIERLRRTGEPETLAVDAGGEIVLLDMASYQKLLERLEYWESVDVLRKRLGSLKPDERRPFEEVLEDLGRKYEEPPSA